MAAGGASQNKMILTAFLAQFEECLQDIRACYPDIMKSDPRFCKVVAFFDTLKGSNPRLIVLTWKEKVNRKYKDRILAGDVEFFLEKTDYREDAPDLYTEETEKVINDLRTTIRAMSPVNVAQCMKYIQNLCRLSDMYAS